MLNIKPVIAICHIDFKKINLFVSDPIDSIIYTFYDSIDNIIKFDVDNLTVDLTIELNYVYVKSFDRLTNIFINQSDPVYIQKPNIKIIKELKSSLILKTRSTGIFYPIETKWTFNKITSFNTLLIVKQPGVYNVECMFASGILKMIVSDTVTISESDFLNRFEISSTLKPSPIPESYIIETSVNGGVDMGDYIVESWPSKYPNDIYFGSVQTITYPDTYNIIVQNKITGISVSTKVDAIFDGFFSVDIDVEKDYTPQPILVISINTESRQVLTNMYSIELYNQSLKIRTVDNIVRVII